MLVIGNGESRKNINLDSLSGPKVGCNAVCRDFYVDHLVCCDRRMVTEALEFKRQDPIYTRVDWIEYFKDHSNVFPVPELPYKGTKRADEPFHWGSGPYAVLFAAGLSEEIELLGFDLYSNDKKINNIYKDTKNYNTGDKRPVDPSYWIYQIGRVIELYADKKFIIYQEENWEIPKSWLLPNVSLDKISKFI